MPKYLFILLLSILLLSACQNQKDSLPNIVFLFADDLTYKAINALGNQEISTPNLDRLMHQGTNFTHAYNMGAWNGAVCAASRAMMISGRHVWQANQFRKEWTKGNGFDQTWGRLMEKAGYRTYMTGKWHVDAPADSVFQTVKHVRPGMPRDQWKHFEMVEKFQNLVNTGKVKPVDIMPLGYNRPQSPQDDSWTPTDPKFGGFWEGGKHWSEVLKDDALSFIQQASTEEVPFFMYLAFNAPHDPRQAPQSYLDQYPLERISLPESWQALHPNQDSIGNGPSLRDEALAPFPRTEFATKTHIKEYYAIISHLDTQIGLILDVLEAKDLIKNTYIFFTADHGLAIGEHGLLGKQNMYDHSIRVPLFFSGPNIPHGQNIDADIYLQDIMATSLELGAIAAPEYLQFNSFLPLAKGLQKESAYPAIYGCYIDLQRMIRKDQFKLIVYPKIKKTLLFDLKKDPNEINNLAEDPAYQSKTKALFQDLIQLQKEMGDDLDLAPIYHQLFD